ncbi:acyl carrier protein [Haloechinothrix halophila]|uniref:acyl carrier protein n=1 Tax=Haloechinothrix halophila TaxID=1069073 RepID=UPI0003F992D4|nr:acyl carrier protein [Haloechinothrix halophila]
MATPATPKLDKDELRNLIAEILDVDIEDVGDETSFIDDLDVDSLMALEVVVVLEKRYGVKLVESEMTRIGCLNDAHALIEDKLGGADR